MSYNPVTDFMALFRETSGEASLLKMPGLDYAVSAMARAGMFRLSVGQNEPTTNVETTVWLKPSVPSWVAEGTVYLWDASTAAYAVATPPLWNNLLAPSGYSFQSVSTVTGIIRAGASLVAVERVAPAVTALVFPPLLDQWETGRPLRIVDWSTNVVNHSIGLTTPDGTTIMRQPGFTLTSNPYQLAGVTFYPSPDLNGWVIAP